MSNLPEIETSNVFLEQLFAPWREIIGNDYPGYRNHVYRMVQCCWAISMTRGQALSKEDKQKTMIAAVFHDIGIWTDHTVDYIGPSIPPAVAYLQASGLDAWEEEISLMISEHHKLRRYTGEHAHLVELFRQADLVDFSLGMVKNGLPKHYIAALKQALPNAGFHKGLLIKGSKWFVRHPFNPAPMMKW